LNRKNDRIRKNHQIRVREVRLVGASGENLGVVPIEEALKKAEENGLDLIEISPQAKPPVAKIGDYGNSSTTRKRRTKTQNRKPERQRPKAFK